MKRALTVWLCASLFLVGSALRAADVVPPQVRMPGSQPEDQVSQLQTAGRCDNCHGGYNPAVEPAYNWKGSVMAHAAGDPIFWATLTIAEQDFDGAGDLCLRCHNPAGWLGGRSTPTDGTGLNASNDVDGIECDLCHRLTDPLLYIANPDGQPTGVQNPPFVAITDGEAHYGSGQYVMHDGNDKLGPFSDAEARHGSQQSDFYRSSNLCGTCHDVSNPVVGDLAPGNGAQTPLDSGTYNGDPGATDLTTMAAFNNPPYKYGVVERTYSEHMASAFPTTPVSAINTLPAELQAGSIQGAYDAAWNAAQSATPPRTSVNYEDGTVRNFTCQSCHMPAVYGQGCNKNPPYRTDLPLHDLSGGNLWMLDVMAYADAQGTLQIGGGFDSGNLAAMTAGKDRALNNLHNAAALSVDSNTNVLTVTNLTGHKLISGYPEGRRMWLNIKWYDGTGTLLREDGEYGTLTVDDPTDAATGGPTIDVETILDLNDPNTRIYEAHGAVTQEWAAALISLGWDPATPVEYDRVTGAVTTDLGQVAAQAPGTYHQTFHFVLNNKVVKDNRIPPWGMRYNDAVERNIVPVPSTQYGNPGSGGVYNHHDEVTLNPPNGATYATIDLLYQSTSWEYIQFLTLANDRGNTFLQNTGLNLFDAWWNAGSPTTRLGSITTQMAKPFVMASATWGTPPACTPDETPESTCDDGQDNDCDTLVDCDDSDCSGDPACQVMTCSGYTSKGECNNDPNCAWQGSPNNGSCHDVSGTIETVCDDSIDNDGDGAIDCADNDCSNDPACQTQANCSQILDRNTCNAEATCRWDSKNKMCVSSAGAAHLVSQGAAAHP